MSDSQLSVMLYWSTLVEYSALSSLPPRTANFLSERETHVMFNMPRVLQRSYIQPLGCSRKVHVDLFSLSMFFTSSTAKRWPLIVTTPRSAYHIWRIGND